MRDKIILTVFTWTFCFNILTHTFPLHRTISVSRSSSGSTSKGNVRTRLIARSTDTALESSLESVKVIMSNEASTSSTVNADQAHSIADAAQQQKPMKELLSAPTTNPQNVRIANGKPVFDGIVNSHLPEISLPGLPVELDWSEELLGGPKEWKSRARNARHRYGDGRNGFRFLRHTKSWTPVIVHPPDVDPQLNPGHTSLIASSELEKSLAGTPESKPKDPEEDKRVTIGEKLGRSHSTGDSILGKPAGHDVKDINEEVQPHSISLNSLTPGSSLKDARRTSSNLQNQDMSGIIQASIQPEEQVASQLPGEAHSHQMNGQHSPNTDRDSGIKQPSTLSAREDTLPEQLQSHDDHAIKSSPNPGAKSSAPHVLTESIEKNPLPESSSGKAFSSGATPIPERIESTTSLSPVSEHLNSHATLQLDSMPSSPIASPELTTLDAGMKKEDHNIEELIPMEKKSLEEIYPPDEPIPGETAGHNLKDTAEGAQPQTTVSEASARGSSLEDETKRGSDLEKKAASEFPTAPDHPEPNHVIGQPSDQVNLRKEDGQNSQSTILDSDREKPTIPLARDNLPAEQTLSHDERVGKFLPETQGASKAPHVPIKDLGNNPFKAPHVMKAFTPAHTATNVSPKKLISEDSSSDWFFQEKKAPHTQILTSMSPHRVPKTVDYAAASFDPEVEMNRHAVYISPTVSFLRRWKIKLYRQWKKFRIFTKKLLPKMVHSRPAEWAKAKWTSIGGWSKWLLHQFVWSPDLAQRFQKYTSHSEVYDVYQLDREIDPLKDLDLGTGNYPGRPYNHIDDLAWLGNQLNLGPYDYYQVTYSAAFFEIFPDHGDRARINDMLRRSTAVGQAQQEWDKAVSDSFRQEQKLLDELGSPEGIDDLMRKISRTLNQKYENTVTSRVEPKQRLKPLYELYKHTALSDKESSRKILQDLSKKVNAKEFKTIQENIETYAPIKAHLSNSLLIFNYVKKTMVEHFVIIEPGMLHRHESEYVDSTRLIKYLEGLEKLVKELKELPDSDPKKL